LRSIKRLFERNSSTPSKKSAGDASRSQRTLKEIKKEEVAFVGGSLEREAKAYAVSGIRRVSAWSLFNNYEEVAEQSDLIS
jgi:hypothetical protein